MCSFYVSASDPRMRQGSHFYDVRVRPLRDLLYLSERGHAERVKRERADGITHIDAIEKQRVPMHVEA